MIAGAILTLKAPSKIMSPDLRGRDIGLGADPVCINVGVVNQWLDSYQIFMDI